METEKRLIDANKYPCQHCEVSYCYKNCEKFNAWFKKTVDAVEVVHGHWERINKYDEDSDVRCSRCKMEFDYIDGMCYLVEGVELPNYCPNCGADMRGNDND